MDIRSVAALHKKSNDVCWNLLASDLNYHIHVNTAITMLNFLQCHTVFVTRLLTTSVHSSLNLVITGAR